MTDDAPRLYKPKLAMLKGAVAYSLSPAIIGLATALLLQGRVGWWIWIPGSVGALLTLNCLIADVLVYFSSIILSEDGFLIHRPGSETAIPWQAVMSVALRERKNAVTRTDHLLLFKLVNGQTVSFCTSALPPEHEQDLLERIGQRLPLPVFQDKPSF